MLGQFLISFREALEATLLVGIMIAYLTKIEQKDHIPHVWQGAGMATVASIILGLSIWFLYGELSEASMKLFEGLAALLAVAVLSYVILWMGKQTRNISHTIQQKLSSTVEAKTRLGMHSLAFVLVFREGLETVLFLIPFSTSAPGATLAGAVLGIVLAGIIAFSIFRLGLSFDLKRFFYFSSLLLVFLAAGLAGYGVHELLEYLEAVGSDPGWLGSYAFKLDISSDSIFYHKGAIGSVFAVLFGYSAKMEWARVIVHLGYLLVVLPLTILSYRSPGLLRRRFTAGSPAVSSDRLR